MWIRQHLARLRRPSVLTLLAFVVSTAATCIVWKMAKVDERAHIRRITLLAASAVRADLDSDMRSWVQEQVRLARLWEVDEPSQSQWGEYAKLYIEHHPGCLGLEWLVPQGEERWIVGAQGARQRAQQRTQDNSIRDHLLKEASGSREPMISSVLSSSDGKKQWLVAVPIYRADRFRGFVIGSFDVQQSLDTMLDDIKELSFSVAVEENGAEIYHLPGNTEQYRNDWEQTLEIPFSGTSWLLRVWARPQAMAEMQSNLPLLVLLAGTLLTLLLTAFAQAHHELMLENQERQRAEQALRASQARFAGILEISAAAVISTDDQQRITLFNQAAESMFGYKAAEALGQPLDILVPQSFREMHRRHFNHFAQSDRNNMLMSTRAPVAGLRKDGTEFPMAASISKLDLEGEKTFTVLCNDITEHVRAAEQLRQARDELESRVLERTADLEHANLSLQWEISERKAREEEVRQLSRRIMRVQDEERRHIARELHDGAAQNLVAVILNLRCLSQDSGYNRAQTARIEECIKLVEQCTTELRTLSYLLHPPLLEEMGLTRTLNNFISGFSQRSGIHITVRIEPELARLEFDAELTLFRIVQEALANIHRHSQSRTAAILLEQQGENVVLEVADHGLGIPAGKEIAGVGIAGMRERVRMLKGQFQIKTDKTGTVLRAVLPCPAEMTDHSWQAFNFEI